MRTSLIKTRRADWYQCIIPSTLIFFSALLVTAWDFFHIQKMNFHLDAVNVIGLILFGAGIIIRRIGKRTLGKYYSYGLRTLQRHKIIKRGIYRHVRHPISLAAIMYSMGIPMVFSSLYGLLLMSGFIPLILNRIGIEERMLLEKFGDEYQEYMKQTKKIIPFIY